MKILIIYTHPSRESFNGAILSNLTENIDSRKHKVKLVDLYAEKFDPVQTHPQDELKPDEVNEYRELILWTDHLIFISPIWWSGMPAILKGFIDRVFSTGFAYKYDKLRPIGLLKDKTAAIFMTSDTPRFYVELVQQDYGKVLKKQVLKFCGIKTTRFMRIDGLHHSSLEKRQKFLEQV